MSKLKDLKDLVQNVNLTEEQIAELLTIIIDMKKKNENAEKGTSLCLGGKKKGSIL